MGTDRKPWLSGPVACPICLRSWVATWHEDTPQLECPDCGFMVEAPQAPEEK